MAYARLQEKAEKVIVVTTKSVKETLALDDGTRKNIWSSKAITLANQPIEEPIEGIEGLNPKNASEIQAWLNDQLNQIDAAHEQNLANGLIGGYPIIKHSKADDSKYASEPGFIPGRKIGEFIGVIAGAKPRRNTGTIQPIKTSEGFVRKMRREGRLSEVTNAIVNELAEIMAESEGSPQEAFTEEERAALYVSERQYFYMITRGMEKMNPLERRAKKEAEAKFERFKASGPAGYLIGKTKPVPVLLQEFAAKQ